jgi:hypothetical protein
MYFVRVITMPFPPAPGSYIFFHDGMGFADPVEVVIWCHDCQRYIVQEEVSVQSDELFRPGNDDPDICTRVELHMRSLGFVPEDEVPDRCRLACVCD